MQDGVRSVSPALSDWSVSALDGPSLRGPPAPSRVCRSLVVEAEAHETGVRSTLYLRIAMPRSTNTQIRLVSLNPLSHLLHHSTYALPLGPESLSASSTESLRAAQLLGLTSDGASSGRGSATSSPQARRHSRSIKLVQEDAVISLLLEGEDSSPSRSLSPTALGSPSPDGAPLARVSSNTSSECGQIEGKEEKLEWILVMRLDSSFGGLQAPRFANGVTIPLPTCLRNTLSFTLPSSESSLDAAPQWDLVVKPPLLTSTSSVPPGEDGPATVTGPFASTSALSIRWAVRGGAHSVVLPQSHLDVTWGIGENGWGRVTVKGEAELDYAGLRDQAWVQLKVDHGVSSSAVGSRSAFEGLSIEGDDVMTWEVEGEGQAIRESEPRRPTRLAREPSSGHATPTPRLRPVTALQESRPPSFTNLFDQAPPEAPELDPAVLTKMSEPSLLRQAAPFEGDVSADMTFEAISLSDDEDEDVEGLTREDRELVNVGRRSSFAVKKSGSATSSPEAPEADADWPREPEHFSTTSTIRMQLNLASLLAADNLPSPSFSFNLTADFPTVTLRALSSSHTSADHHSFRLALPTFSLPAAVHEESVVTVSAGTGGSVELLATDPMMQAPAEGSDDTDSPLPAMGGKARWRTERSWDENSGRRSRNSSELVEVEVSLPPSRPSSHIQLDDLADSDDSPSGSPSPAARKPRSTRQLQRGQTPSFQSLRAKSSAHSLGLNLASAPLSLAYRPPTTLGLVKLRITPVPPGQPEQPWRLFTHLTFPRPFVGTFDLPLKDEQDVAVCDSWNERGESTLVESETLERVGEGRKMRIETGLSRKGSPVVARNEEVQEEDSEGLNEMLYCVSTKEQDGQVELGDVLPKLGLKVSSMEVEVLPVAGYDLLTDHQSFDSATPAQDGVSTRFTRFQIPVLETSRLSVSLQPSNSAPSTPPSPSVESNPPSPTGPSPVKTTSFPSPPPREPTPPPPPELAVEPSATPVVEPALPPPVKTLAPPHESPALPSLPPSPAVEPASQADWAPSVAPAAPSPGPEAAAVPLSEAPASPVTKLAAKLEGVLAPTPSEEVTQMAPALDKHDTSASPTSSFTPASLPLSASPVEPPRSLISSLIRILPLIIFLVAVAINQLAPGRLQQLGHIDLLGEKGPWPSFDSAGELVLESTPMEILTAAEAAPEPTSIPVVSLSSIPTIAAPITAHPSLPSPPLPSTAAPPLPPVQPQPTYADDLPPMESEGEAEAVALEEAGFPSVLAEIIASWKSLGEDVKGWVGWLIGLMRL